MYYNWFEILKDLNKNLMITTDNSIQNSENKFQIIEHSSLREQN
jgi:hypothetical protein